MAQFDVFRNPGRQRAAAPFVIVLQNARFDRLATRFVAPLFLQTIYINEAHYIAPRFVVAGLDVVLDVFNLTTISADRLVHKVATLDDDQSRLKLVGALDELVSQA
jgi:toxin CcdB